MNAENNITVMIITTIITVTVMDKIYNNTQLKSKR